MKTCRKCLTAKPHSEFFRSSKYSDGLQFWCKECQRFARSGKRTHRNHGESKSPLYRHWKSMHTRCRPHGRHRRWYHDRGITVCPAWRSWTPFKAWAEANGYRDDLSLDRIDNDKGYSPRNCQWIPLAENVRKARREDRKAAVGGEVTDT